MADKIEERKRADLLVESIRDFLYAEIDSGREFSYRGGGLESRELPPDREQMIRETKMPSFIYIISANHEAEAKEALDLLPTCLEYVETFERRHFFSKSERSFRQMKAEARDRARTSAD